MVVYKTKCLALSKRHMLWEFSYQGDTSEWGLGVTLNLYTEERYYKWGFRFDVHVLCFAVSVQLTRWTGANR
jgi:hypothetical protein